MRKQDGFFLCAELGQCNYFVVEQIAEFRNGSLMRLGGGWLFPLREAWTWNVQAVYGGERVAFKMPRGDLPWPPFAPLASFCSCLDSLPFGLLEQKDAKDAKDGARRGSVGRGLGAGGWGRVAGERMKDEGGGMKDEGGGMKDEG